MREVLRLIDLFVEKLGRLGFAYRDHDGIWHMSCTDFDLFIESLYLIDDKDFEELHLTIKYVYDLSDKFLKDDVFFGKWYHTFKGLYDFFKENSERRNRLKD